MDFKEEALALLHELWAKLQGLPQASSLELGAFIILFFFIAAFLFMIGVSCFHGCCRRRPRQRSRVEPLDLSDPSAQYYKMYNIQQFNSP